MGSGHHSNLSFGGLKRSALDRVTTLPAVSVQTQAFRGAAYEHSSLTIAALSCSGSDVNVC